MPVIAACRRIAILADLVDDAPETTTLRDVERAVRKALADEGFEVGTLDVRMEPAP